MGTKEFNLLDKLIARMRLGRVLPYVKNGDTVLDFGCGHQAYLLRHIVGKASSAVGIDYDATDGQIAPHIKTKKFHFKTKLPFGDKNLDTVFMLAVLEHLQPDTTKLLFAEFNRILKPGGKVVLTTPTPLGKILLELLAFRLGVISRDEVADHKKYYSKTDIEKLAKESKFTVRSYETFWLGMNSFAVLENHG